MRTMIMRWSPYWFYRNWRRRVAARCLAAEYGEDTPLGIG
jgi:hypothetical protein